MALELFGFRHLGDLGTGQRVVLKEDLAKIYTLGKDAVVELDEYFKAPPGRDAPIKAKIKAFATDVMVLAQKYLGVGEIRAAMLEAIRMARLMLDLTKMNKNVAAKEYLKGSFIVMPARKTFIQILARLLRTKQRISQAV